MSRTHPQLNALLLGLLFVLQGTPGIAQVNTLLLPERSSEFRIVLQTNKPSYITGDAILIRLAIENISSRHYRVQAAPSFYLASLLIKDKLGNVQSSTGITGLVRVDAHAYDFPPGKKIEPGWQSAEDPSGAWVNLRLWGYTLGPGTYTIEAVPRFNAFEVNGDVAPGAQVRIARVPSSNSATITITDKSAHP